MSAEEIEDAMRFLEEYKDQTERSKKKSDNVCVECDESDSFTISDGFMVCSECGYTKQYISDEAEWNNYRNSDGSGQDKSRAYCAKDELNPFSNELGSRMGKGLKSTYFNKDGVKKTVDLSRLQDQFNYSHKQKSFDTVRNLMDNTLSNKIHQLPIQTAEILWGEIMKSGKVTRGGVRKGLIACCVYYACIHSGFTISPSEICKYFGMQDTKDFIKGDKEFKEIFEFHNRWGYLVTNTTKSDDFIGPFCSKLNIEFHLERKCSILFKYHWKKLSVVQPKSAAAGCIYYVCVVDGLENGISCHVTKPIIYEKLKVCIPTISKVYQILDHAEKKRIRKGIKLDFPTKVRKTWKTTTEIEFIKLGTKGTQGTQGTKSPKQ